MKTALYCIFGVLAFVPACVATSEDDHGESTARADEALAGIHGNLAGGATLTACWNFDGWAHEKQVVQSAVASTWEAVSNARVRWRDSCTGLQIGGNTGLHTGDADIRIDIRDENNDNPHSPVGGSMWTNMALNFQFNNWDQEAQGFNGTFSSNGRCKDDQAHRDYCIRLVAAHEFGHAFGFTHEQNRADAPSCTRQGQDPDWYYTSYDANSIMNYCAPKWNNWGQLSPLDIAGVQAAYGAHPPDQLNLERWATAQGGWVDESAWLSGDFNGDKKSDLALAWNDGGFIDLDVHVSDGASFRLERWATHEGGWVDPAQWVTADFNRDGLTDVAKAWKDGNGLVNIDVHLSTGHGFVMQRWATQQGGWVDPGVWLGGDFNGDGYGDIALVWKDGSGIDIDVHASNGYGFSGARWATGQGGWVDSGHFAAGDFDGDGRTDIGLAFEENGGINLDAHFARQGTFEGRRMATNQGTWVDSGHWMAVDMNGDHLADMVNAWDQWTFSSVDAHLSQRTSFSLTRFQTRQGEFIEGGVWLPGDFNGDGRSDVANPYSDRGVINIDVHKQPQLRLFPGGGIRNIGL